MPARLQSASVVPAVLVALASMTSTSVAFAAPPVAPPQRYSASVESYVVTESSQVLPAWTPSASLVNTYGQRLGGSTPSGSWGVDRRATTHLLVAFGIADWAQLDVGVPMLVYQDGSTGNTTTESALNSAAFGDVRTGIKGTFLRAKDRGFGLGASFDVTYPTGDRGALWGEAGLTYAPQLLLEYRGPRGIETALNAGYLVRPDQTYGQYVIGDVVTYRAAVRVPMGKRLNFALSGELDGAVGVVDGSTSPLSALGGLRWRMRSGVVLGMYGGGAIVRGFGVPDVQGLLTVGYVPPARIGRERAFEGNETPDALALARRYERVAALHQAPETRQAPFDPDDRDRDGVLAAADACPNVAEDLDGFDDDDGCPELDNDRDGLRDSLDMCPTAPEVTNGWADWDGCPDRWVDADHGESTTRFDPAIHLPKITFAVGTDALDTEGAAAVTELAELLALNPWMGELELMVGVPAESAPGTELAAAAARGETLRRALEEAGVDSWRYAIVDAAVLSPEAHPPVEIALEDRAEGLRPMAPSPARRETRLAEELRRRTADTGEPAANGSAGAPPLQPTPRVDVMAQGPEEKVPAPPVQQPGAHAPAPTAEDSEDANSGPEATETADTKAPESSH